MFCVLTQRWRRHYLATNLEPAGVAQISKTLEVTSHPRNLLQIHSILDQFETEAIEVSGNGVRMVFDAFRTAAIEIATNILRHAYPPDSPNAPVRLELNLFRTYLEAIFHDQGVAFTQPDEIAPPDLDNIDILDMPEGNLGLFLALQALDKLEYVRTPAGVNQWRLVKQLQEPNATPAS